MRIVSNYHDYYDCVQSIDQDRTLIFSRVKKSVFYERKKEFPFNYPIIGNYRTKSLTLMDYSVGFCGKIYPIVKLQKPGLETFSQECLEKWCFNIDDVDKFVSENFRRTHIDLYNEKEPNSSKYEKQGWAWGHRRKFFLDFFNKIDSKKAEEIFDKEKCPIFVVDYAEKSITFNDCLNDFEFYRLFDPYQAFQEISMYLSNIAIPQKPIPEISDEILAQAKGFDKFSFRKDKK